MRVELLLGKQIEDRIRYIAAAGALSQFEGSIFDVLDTCEVYEENEKLIRRIINMGHESIIDHDYFVFAISNVSLFLEQKLIEHRLASFTIKSGRYVDFRNVGHYTPTFKDKDGNLLKNNDELVEKYKKHASYLFDNYEHFVDNGVEKEDARFILPYSVNTNIVMGMDVRGVERLLNEFLYGKLSAYDEVKEFGNKVLSIVEEYAPYLVKKIGKNFEEGNWYDKYKLPTKIKKYDEVKLVSNTANVDRTIIETSIMYHEQVTKRKAKSILNKMIKENPNVMEEMMSEITKSLEQREFEQVNFQFEIPISLIVLKHLTRHRMQSILIPEFTPLWNLDNYQTPPSIKKYNVELFDEIQKKNKEMFNYFKKQGVRDQDLIYFYLCGTSVNVTTTMNGRTLEWISRLRCCTRAQWEFRNIANSMVRQVKEVAPLFGNSLGATCDIFGYCPEGKKSCGKVNAKVGAK